MATLARRMKHRHCQRMQNRLLLDKALPGVADVLRRIAWLAWQRTLQTNVLGLAARLEAERAIARAREAA